MLLISNTRKQLESIIITIAPIVTFPPSARPDSDADHLFFEGKIINTVTKVAWDTLQLSSLLGIIKGDERSPQPILGQRYSMNCIARFSRICPYSWDARVVPTNMHGIWPRRLWC